MNGVHVHAHVCMGVCVYMCHVQTYDMCVMLVVCVLALTPKTF